MPQAPKPLRLTQVGRNPFSHFQPSSLWGNKNWATKYKHVEVGKFREQNWPSLYAPESVTPWCHPLLGCFLFSPLISVIGPLRRHSPFAFARSTRAGRVKRKGKCYKLTVIKGKKGKFFFYKTSQIVLFECPRVIHHGQMPDLRVTKKFDIVKRRHAIGSLALSFHETLQCELVEQACVHKHYNQTY